MAKIDDVRFHLPSGWEDSEELYDEYLIPMGVFVVWAARKELLNFEEFEEDGSFLRLVDEGEYDYRDVTDFELDGKLCDFHFNELGAAFAKAYYMSGGYPKDIESSHISHDKDFAMSGEAEKVEYVMALLDKKFAGFLSKDE